MKIRGKVAFGLHRGGGVVEKYQARLMGIVGFKPFRGTLNVKMDRDVSIKSHSTRTIEHKLVDGTTKIEAYLAPVKIRLDRGRRFLKGMELEGDETVSTYKWKGRDAFSLRKKGKFVTWGIIETEEERKIVEELEKLDKLPKEEKKLLTGSGIDCWAIMLTSGVSEDNMIEIIAPQKLTEALDIHDGTEIEIEFTK